VDRAPRIAVVLVATLFTVSIVNGAPPRRSPEGFDSTAVPVPSRPACLLRDLTAADGRQLNGPGDPSGDSNVEANSDCHGSNDFYGNDVTHAVATYSLDPSGTLYEEHSPGTEVPRLGSPKS